MSKTNLLRADFKHPRQEIRLESWGLLLITITSIAALIKFVLDIVDYFIK